MNRMAGNVVVVGGGTAGVEAAGQLAKAGVYVTIVEKENAVGGHVKNWHHLFPDRRKSSEVIDYLKKQLKNDKIKLITGEIINEIEKRGNKFNLKSDSGMELKADAVVLASGFDLFRSERKEEYGYGIYNNVITSADLEEMFRKDSIILKNGITPESIGIIHCVGSRDEKVGNLYCSKLCCVTAVKQAIELKEHLPASRVFCFYMDMRMGGALYEEMYREAQEKYGISFIRGKVSEISENIVGRLVTKVEDTLAGRPMKIEMDMIVLMAGMEISREGELIEVKGQLKKGQNRFFAPVDYHFGSNISNIRGLFLAGTCTAPMNITETISHARGAVSDVLDYLNDQHLIS
jgi:heterodisulfide reductase subunit A